MRVIQKVEDTKTSAEERLKVVEGQLGSMEGRLGSIEGQLGFVQEELSKMRQLFSKLFEKGVEGFTDDPLTKGDVLDAMMVEPSLRGPVLAEGESGGGVDEERG